MYHNHLIFPTPDTNSLDLKCFDFFQSTENDGVLWYQGHFSHTKYKSNDSVLRYLHPCLVALQSTENDGVLRYQGHFSHIKYKSNDSVLRYLHPCLVALQLTESGGFLRYQGQFYYLNYFFISQLSLRHDTNGVLQYPNFYYFYRYTYTHLMFLRLVLRYLLENPVAVPAAVPTSIQLIQLVHKKGHFRYRYLIASIPSSTLQAPHPKLSRRLQPAARRGPRPHLPCYLRLSKSVSLLHYILIRLKRE